MTQQPLQKIRQILDQSVDTIDLDIAGQLTRARYQALSSRQQFGQYAFNKHWVIACSVLLVFVGSFWMMKNTSMQTNNETLLLVEDQSLTEDELEILEDLEFYQWLAQRRQQG